jgi:hypothetical protein
VQFGKSITAAAPGSLQDLYLVVSDIESTRQELIGKGVEVSDAFHCGTGFVCRFDAGGTADRVVGRDERSYFTFAKFSDPDGNGWLLQEITTRLPGR